MLRELIYETAYLGYAVGAVLVLLGVSALVGLVVYRKSSDEFTPIGRADSAPPRRSPFSPGRGNDDATAARRDTTVLPRYRGGGRRG